MSWGRLSAKSIRRIERTTGLTIERAWGYGGYEFDCRVPIEGGHEHWIFDKKTGTARLVEEPQHFTSCDAFDRGEETP